MIVSADLKPDVESLELLSPSSMTPVAFYTPAMAVAFKDGLDTLVHDIEAIFVDDSHRQMFCSLQEIIAYVGDLQIFDLRLCTSARIVFRRLLRSETHYFLGLFARQPVRVFVSRNHVE